MLQSHKLDANVLHGKVVNLAERYFNIMLFKETKPTKAFKKSYYMIYDKHCSKCHNLPDIFLEYFLPHGKVGMWSTSTNYRQTRKVEIYRETGKIVRNQEFG